MGLIEWLCGCGSKRDKSDLRDEREIVYKPVSTYDPDAEIQDVPPTGVPRPPTPPRGVVRPVLFVPPPAAITVEAHNPRSPMGSDEDLVFVDPPSPTPAASESTNCVVM